jgi:regulator of protease activity HflC (stomatin/prohibitin superfamily)
VPFPAPLLVLGLIVLLIIVVIVFRSFRFIGAAEVGLVNKRAGRKLTGDQAIAFDGEAGYQAELLMPGLRFKLWPVYSVTKHPWVRVSPGEIGVVISQLGAPLPIGAKSAEYKPVFANFTDLDTFLAQGGQKGVQRPVLPPGIAAPPPPAGVPRPHGEPCLRRPDVERRPPAGPHERHLRPQPRRAPRHVRTAAGGPGRRRRGHHPRGLRTRRRRHRQPARRLLGHHGARGLGRRGRREDRGDPVEQERAAQQLPGLPGVPRPRRQDRPAARPAALRRVPAEPVPRARRAGADARRPNQGEVAVIKAYVGLPTVDTSGEEFKFGSIVRPGHRGIWQEPLRTGKYPINPRLYAAEIVPTSILTLNWANGVDRAQPRRAPVADRGKSREGFVFRIDLQVQIHVPDTRAPKVISMVGTMQNLVNEVLQSAVGQPLPQHAPGASSRAFIETRDVVQTRAQEYITGYLSKYDVETSGVYIQDVDLPARAGGRADRARDREPGRSRQGCGLRRSGEGPWPVRNGRRGGRRGRR